MLLYSAPFLITVPVTVKNDSIKRIWACSVSYRITFIKIQFLTL